MNFLTLLLILDLIVSDIQSKTKTPINLINLHAFQLNYCLIWDQQISYKLMLTFKK